VHQEIVQVVNKDICEETFLYYAAWPKESLLCTGFVEKPDEPCFQTFGTPLVCNYRLAGILSWTSYCTNPKIFSSVNYDFKWIQAKIQKYENDFDRDHRVRRIFNDLGKIKKSIGWI